jgi:multicomponent Na+:H+ antiporter subunit B
MISVVEIGLFVFVVATALATVLLRDVLAAVVVFAAYSLGMAILYAFLLAPDVAMTEAAIGAGVTTLLMLLTLARTVHANKGQFWQRPNVPGLIVMGALLVVLLVTVGEFPEVGAASQEALAWWNPAVTQHYIEHAYDQTGVTNAVTAVLAGYRGFDTFGEATVVFAAGIAILIVLNREVFTGE